MQTQVWGILNVTPDSFSDGGSYLEPAAALNQARSLVAAGADVIDIGGESTRPGAVRVSAAEELQRVLPVITELAAAGITVSIDTMRAEVAQAAVAAGARIVNDVSGGKADPAMHSTMAELGVDYVLMHWRGHSEVMNELTDYQDVVADVISEWQFQAARAVRFGIKTDHIIFDPGLGFAKDAAQNWQLLAALDRLKAQGHRLLIGASRKRFLAEVSAPAAKPAERDPATAAISSFAALHDCYAVRVHDVVSSVAAVRTVARLKAEGI